MQIRLVAEREGLSPISGIEPMERGEAESMYIESSKSLLEGCSNKSKSSSEDTVRPQRVDAVHNATADVRRNSPKHVARQEIPGSKARAFGGKNPKDQESGSLGSAGKIIASSSSSDQTSWRIHYSRPPLSIAIASGPMPWADLARRLSLNDETMTSLQGLATINQHGLRIQIIGDLAFIYDPIILEGPSTTCLIDWGRKSRNMGALKYITRGRTVNPVFHTFFFPVKMDCWYYFGAMTWTTIEQRSMWPALSIKSKAKLTAKLKDRCGGNLGKEEIIRLIEEDSLQQICFEISGHSTMAASRSFALKMGFGPPSGSE